MSASVPYGGGAAASTAGVPPRCATGHAAAGSWPESERRAAAVLAHDDRHLRRKRLLTDDGCPLLVDLPQAVVLRHGDGLALEGGGWIAIAAAEEDVLEIEAGTEEALARLAWHLGNRHTPTQIGANVLRVAYDHVLAHMLEGLGARVRRRRAPFEPEGGAYAGHGH